jgi:hypothetical protein
MTDSDFMLKSLSASDAISNIKFKRRTRYSGYGKLLFRVTSLVKKFTDCDPSPGPDPDRRGFNFGPGPGPGLGDATQRSGPEKSRDRLARARPGGAGA